MRIIRKECIKILVSKRLPAIILFTVLYYILFMQIQKYPYIFSWGIVSQQRYVSELVEDVGPSLSGEEWHRMEAKRQELLAKVREICSANAVLADAGIYDYETWLEAYQELFFIPDENKLSDENSILDNKQKLRREVMALYQQEGESQKCLTLLQYIDNLEYIHELGCLFSVPASEAETVAREYWGHATPLFQKAIAVFCQRDLSMLPHMMFMLLWEDMHAMTILLVICSLILLIPCQIHEKLCEVTALYATTRTGRRIFGKQFAAHLIACGFVSALQLLV